MNHKRRERAEGNLHEAMRRRGEGLLSGAAFLSLSHHCHTSLTVLSQLPNGLFDSDESWRVRGLEKRLWSGQLTLTLSVQGLLCLEMRHTAVLFLLGAVTDPPLLRAEMSDGLMCRRL